MTNAANRVERVRVFIERPAGLGAAKLPLVADETGPSKRQVENNARPGHESETLKYPRGWWSCRSGRS